VKLYDCGWWYTTISPHYLYRYNDRKFEYSKTHSPGFDFLLFNGNVVARCFAGGERWYCPHGYEEFVALRHDDLESWDMNGYVFKSGFVPKPEDFEVVQ